MTHVDDLQAAHCTQVASDLEDELCELELALLIDTKQLGTENSIKSLFDYLSGARRNYSMYQGDEPSVNMVFGNYISPVSGTRLLRVCKRILAS